MKVIVLMIREIIKMLNRYAVDNPTLPINRRFFHPFTDPGGMLSRSLECRAAMIGRRINDGPPSNHRF